MTKLAFEPLYYADRLHHINPSGDVGIITLWSPFPAVKRTLETAWPSIFDTSHSRVAVVSNLYGDGMYAMFCNLLFNPQIRHLVAVGEDLGLPTCSEIEAFLEGGLEDTLMLGKEMKRIKGTERLFPAIAEFDESRLRANLSFRYLGKLSRNYLSADLKAYLNELPRSSAAMSFRRLRVNIPVPSAEDYLYRPSEVTAHQVIRGRPLDCWEELVVRGMRFGRPVTLRDGPRLELLNTKAVITAPARESEEVLAKFGFSLERLLEYQRRVIQPEFPGEVQYTYGNRLRGYFLQEDGSTDTLQTTIDGLRLDRETRRAYVSLWDTSMDLATVHKGAECSAPCLTSLFFRYSDGCLSLSATFRSHNLLMAWLENVYGLMAIQRYVADAVDIPIGPITVVSHSLAIDPRSTRYELAQHIVDGWKRDDDIDRITGKRSLREDPNGYFVVTVDKDQGCIVAEHRFNGVLIKQYRARRAIRIEREIIGDMAVSLVSHALWLGRELASKEQILYGRSRMRDRRGGSAGE